MVAEQRRTAALTTVGGSRFVDLRSLARGREFQVSEVALVVGGRPSARRFALKVATEPSERAEECFAREREALRSCAHSAFVPTLHGCDERKLAMVLEIGRFDMNRLQGRLPVAWSRYICASLTLALEHVHSSGHVHADIKLENVLLSCDGTPMLADFGEAVPLPTLDATVQLESFRGTPSYSAPEMITSFRVSRASDLWALGVALYRMLFGTKPFQLDTSGGDEVIMRSATDAVQQPLLKKDGVRVDEDGWDLVQLLMRQEPAERLGFARSNPRQFQWTAPLYSDIRAHPFFRGIDWARLAEKRLSPLTLQPPLDVCSLAEKFGAG